MPNPSRIAEAVAPLAVTLGEPAGIGPELLLAAWRQERYRDDAPSGDLPAFVWIAPPALAAHRLPDAPLRPIRDPREAKDVLAEAIPVLWPDRAPAIAEAQLARFRPGHPDPELAPTVIASISIAAQQASSGAVSAIVTLPIQKSTLYRAGFRSPGHTEHLAALAGLTPQDVAMMLAIPGLRVVPLTIHCPLHEVPARITPERLRRTARILARSLARDFGIVRPRIAVAGLNPHAGEDGALGEEEQKVIAPTIVRLRQDDGLDIDGPHPADTLFAKHARSRYDAAIAMYHDQALIPIKALDFAHGVNVTLGLPWPRTSPDHGTALDLVGTGRASPESLLAALATAARMAAVRAASASLGERT